VAIRKLTTVLAVIAVGAVGGMIGQSLSANAGAPKAGLTDKVFYAKANPSFVSSDTTTPGTAKTVLQVTVHVPSAGQLDVIINTSMWTDYPSSAASTLFAEQTFARCSAPDTLSTSAPASCANLTTYYFQKPVNTSSSDITEPYALQGQLNFSGSGTRTFFLNDLSTNYTGGLYSGAHVQVAFTPKNPISNNAVVTVTATT
jgi:hypothetical protein